jgi:hypothetical protein
VRRFALLLAAVVCSACVTSVPLGTAIGPGAPAAGRSSEKAGVVCGERLLAHVERGSAGAFSRRYELELGEPLCGALVRSVEGAYRAARREIAPHKGEYGRVIEFDLHESALHILPQPDGSTRVVYTASVVVARYGRDLQPLGRNAVTGRGLVETRALTGDVVRQAVESALQQIADGTSSLLVTRQEGPRLPGPGSSLAR